MAFSRVTYVVKKMIILVEKLVVWITHAISNVEIISGSIECVEEGQLSLSAGIVHCSVPILRRWGRGREGGKRGRGNKDGEESGTEGRKSTF